MSDPKIPSDLGDVDWDEALAEWEEKSFSPEVAPDAVTDKSAALSGNAPPRPLYRPPAGNDRPTPPPRLVPLDEIDPGSDEDDGGATLIAAIPEELLRQGDDRDRSSSSRGGLGQFFARDASIEHETDRPAAGSEPTDPPDLVTSAKSIASRSGAPVLEPLRRVPALDAAESVAEGELFDPFAEYVAVPPNVATAAARSTATTPSLHPDPEARGAAERPGTAFENVTAVRRPLAPAGPPPEDGPHLDRSGDGGASAPPAAVAGEAAAEIPTGPASPPPGPSVWGDEKPADDWLDEAGREIIEERAAWLADEARASSDAISTGRGLLACSELLAIAGRRERAQAMAAEARGCAASIALAHRQARMLMPWPPDPEDHVEALELEIRSSDPGPAQIHSILLEAEALRARGDDDGASGRLELAAQIGTADVRAAVLRAAGALAVGAPSASASRLSNSTDPPPLADAVATCLRLRGTGRIDDAEPGSPSEALILARRAIASADLPAAARAVARLADVPELASSAAWLAASLAATSRVARPFSIDRLESLVQTDDAAVGPLVARAIELRDPDAAASAFAYAHRLAPADRLALEALVGRALPPTGDANRDPAIEAVDLRPLVCAAFAVMPGSTPGRAERAAGALQSRVETELGRRLAARAPDPEISGTLERLPRKTASAHAVAIELWSRAGRLEDISRTVEGWTPSKSSAGYRAMGALAAALLAERAGAATRAAEAFKAAHAADPGCEVAVRALASPDPIDCSAELSALADEWGDGGLRSAVIRIEAVARGGSSLPLPTQRHLLELAHRCDPRLPVASFLAERIARRSGDLEEVLRWIRGRREESEDPVERALEGVREALLVADSDPDLAGRRMREAHETRPRDVALRDLYERMAAEPPDDVAPWRERRAAETSGDAHVLLSLEAAYEYERKGDDEGALRSASTAAAASGASLARIARERAELHTGRVARLTDELIALARATSDGDERREVYERLAALDAIGRNDAASALLWHRSVLELAPEHLPSLRHAEHHLIGEGREDELEGIAASIARALRGTGPGEGTAHAEVAARLRLRVGSSDAAGAREMVDLASSESSPSLWSVRALYNLARTQGDDAGTLAAAKLVADRLSRPLEAAFVLVRGAEAAFRLGLHEQARLLLERATVQDPGDVVAWSLLARVRRRTGDLRGSADALESMARSSAIARRQVSAWYEAGSVWMDEVGDGERAVAALESAAALDLAHADVFDRLARLYAERGLQPELADLLKRRIDGLSDPDERLAIEVRRGRVLLEVGEVAGARRAFEAALAQRPDDPGALTALADLCVTNRDWQTAEQALVRLARLLPAPQEQRAVYARLADLYSHHLVNLSRAEVALKEVLKRAPDDLDTMQKLVAVHKRQNDPSRAVDLQRELVARAGSPAEKRERILDLASIQEQIAHDLRRAERTLDAARRDAPQDVALLRAQAEFYLRHQQGSAVTVLLDRAAADARRALAAGPMAPEFFDMIATVFELRGQPKAAAAALSFLAAVEGKPSQFPGAAERALDPALDDALAPELLSPAIRALLSKAGDILDAASPLDLRDLRATPLGSSSPVARLAVRTAAAAGLQGLQVFSSSKLGSVCLPGGPSPVLVLGEPLANDEPIGGFLALRALKLIRAKASALVRSTPTDVGVLVSAWLKGFHPTWEPRAIPASALVAARARLQPLLPRHADPDVAILAVEASATVDGRQASLASAAAAWGNRAALLALGDPTAALGAVGRTAGAVDGPSNDPQERAGGGSPNARSAEGRDLVGFGVGEAFAQTRRRLGLGP